MLTRDVTRLEIFASESFGDNASKASKAPEFLADRLTPVGSDGDDFR